MIRSPLHHWHVAHGARMTESDGWQVPASYPGIPAGLPTGLALADIGATAKVSLRGPGVPELTGILVGDGQATRLLGVTKLIGNVLACRLAEDHLLLLANAPRIELRQSDYLLRTSARDCECRFPHSKIIPVNATSAYAGFALIGDRLEDMLRQLTAVDVSPTAFPEQSCLQTSLAGVHALLVRSKERGNPCVRIHVDSDLGEYVWEGLMEVGQAWKITPLGVEDWLSIRETVARNG